MPYTGRDGLTHQETRIDWDIRPKISTAHTSAKDKQEIDKQLVEYRKQLIKRILATNPAAAGERYLDYVKRDFETKTLSWEVTMISDEGMDINNLRDMVVILEKRDELLNNNDLDLKTPQVKR